VIENDERRFLASIVAPDGHLDFLRVDLIVNRLDRDRHFEHTLDDGRVPSAGSGDRARADKRT